MNTPEEQCILGFVQGLEPRETRRQLEQQRQELPRLEPEQEQAGELEQQQRVPACLARSSTTSGGYRSDADQDEVQSEHAWGVSGKEKRPIRGW